MTMYLTVLYLHILSAFVIFALIGLSIYAIFIKKAIVKNTAKLLAVSSLVQVISGSTLMFLSTNGDVVTFCKNISLYLGLVFITEIALLKKSNQLDFPKSFVFSTSFFSLIITVSTVLFFVK